MALTSGVLLLALGSPAYGKLAHNLALTMRHSDPSVRVCLGWAGSALDALDDGDRLVFDELRRVPDECYQTPAGPKYLRAKLHMDEVSPFERTLFVDADTVWFDRPVTAFCDDLRGVSFTSQNLGLVRPTNGDYYFARVSEACAAHGVTGGFSKVNSCLVYFERGDVSSEVFKLARAVHDSPGVQVRPYYGEASDELALSLACSKLHAHPHEAGWTPLYFNYLSGKVPGHDKVAGMQAAFVGLTMTRGHVTPRLVDFYNQRVREAASRVGARVFDWSDKALRPGANYG